MEWESLVLVLFLMHERAQGTASQYYAYMATLPNSHSTTLFWPDQLLQRLGGSVLYNATVQRRVELQSLHAIVVATLGPSGLAAMCDWSSFLWATATVDSRAFRVLRDGVETTVLAPLADMVNHTFDTPVITSKRFDSQTRALVLSASAPHVSAGEVTMCYGELDNARLLLFYGFAVDENPYDRLELLLEPPDGDELVSAKGEALVALGCGLGHELSAELREVPRLVLSLRLLLLEDSEESRCWLARLMKAETVTEVQALFLPLRAVTQARENAGGIPPDASYILSNAGAKDRDVLSNEQRGDYESSSRTCKVTRRERNGVGEAGMMMGGYEDHTLGPQEVETMRVVTDDEYPLGTVLSGQNERMVLETLCGVVGEQYGLCVSQLESLMAYSGEEAGGARCFLRGQLHIIAESSSFFSTCLEYLTRLGY